MTLLTTPDALRALYESVRERSAAKELPALDVHATRFIGLSPFVVVATGGVDGMDASPRGGAPGFVKVVDAHTLLIPDSPGNNRLDTLQNIIHTPQVGLLFMVPGVDETLRVNGTAVLSVDEAERERRRIARDHNLRRRIEICWRTNLALRRCQASLFHFICFDAQDCSHCACATNSSSVICQTSSGLQTAPTSGSCNIACLSKVTSPRMAASIAISCTRTLAEQVAAQASDRSPTTGILMPVRST